MKLYNESSLLEQMLIIIDIKEAINTTNSVDRYFKIISRKKTTYNSRVSFV